MGDKVRTLSDAILLGSTFRKQSFQDIYNRGRTCALGAAAEAIGIDVTKFISEDDSIDEFYIRHELDKRFPHDAGDTFEAEEMQCPVMRCGEAGNPYDIVTHLNDEHKWKRERIAEYLKTKGL